MKQPRSTIGDTVPSTQDEMPRTRANRSPTFLMVLLLVVSAFAAAPSKGSETQPETDLASTKRVDLHDFPKASFHEGLAAIRLGDRWGYVDPEGRLTIAPRFEHALAFSEGLARIKIGGRYGYIDQSGRIVVAPRFTKAHSFRDGLARVCSPPPPERSTLLFRIFQQIGWDDREAYLCGYIDRTGALVIDYQYVPARGFENGYARVTSPDGRAGYIDHEGQFTLTRPSD